MKETIFARSAKSRGRVHRATATSNNIQVVLVRWTSQYFSRQSALFTVPADPSARSAALPMGLEGFTIAIDQVSRLELVLLSFCNHLLTIRLFS
jgi:hypothetical protein